MSKAYDRIEWSYVANVMTALGFSDKWGALISSCISSVSFSLILNGKRCGYFVPYRGIRQGDPLSPYVFILCAEGLVSLVKDAENKGIIRGFKPSREAPQISHLLFADDSLLFFLA